MKKYLLFLLVCSACSFIAKGVPAYPDYVNITQPDGSEIKIRIIGDEYGHFIMNQDGEYLKPDETGFYVKYDPDVEKERMIFEKRRLQKSSKYNAGNNKKGIGLLSKANFPTQGEPRSLVVLADFPNKSFRGDNPADYFNRMLNSDKFTDHGAIMSVRQYFKENSNGLFVPQFDVIGPVTLPNNYQYYGENVIKNNDIVGDYLDDARPWEIVTDACKILKEQGFDFSVYDCNDDGEIDNIYIFYAGYGEADGGEPSTIWPHSENLFDILKGEDPIELDGLLLNHYACSNELQTATQLPDGFGTFLHEFSHVLGFPDLYPLNGEAVITPDYWDVMDTGCYLNNSRTPPCYSSFERFAFGWLEPEIIVEEGEYELTALSKPDGNAYLIYTSEGEDNPGEFFMLENRQKHKEDKYIPGHGMLVWHIDFDQDDWDDNMINSDPAHPRVRIIEADNTPGHYDILELPGQMPVLVFNPENEGDPFPGSNGITNFTKDSTPAFLDWNDNPTGFDIIDITESASGLIKFRITDNRENNIVGISNSDKGNIFIDLKDPESLKNALPLYDISGKLIINTSQTLSNIKPGFYISQKLGKIIVR